MAIQFGVRADSEIIGFGRAVRSHKRNAHSPFLAKEDFNGLAQVMEIVLGTACPSACPFCLLKVHLQDFLSFCDTAKNSTTLETAPYFPFSRDKKTAFTCYRRLPKIRSNVCHVVGI
jgi:hypothetical protein